jgi:hypothetical protein
MADESRIKKLQKEIDITLAFKSKKLISRSEWGSINFTLYGVVVSIRR